VTRVTLGGVQIPYSRRLASLSQPFVIDRLKDIYWSWPDQTKKNALVARGKLRAVSPCSCFINGLQALTLTTGTLINSGGPVVVVCLSHFIHIVHILPRAVQLLRTLGRVITPFALHGDSQYMAGDC